jgi:murein DD-endopeptidase MepM/ murein hydrolase activator NlpD
VLAGLVLSGIVAAFATIPPQSDAELALAHALVIEPLPIQTAAQVLPVPERFIREERFQSGETLGGLLSRLGVADDDAARLLRMKELRRLRPGATVTGEIGADGGLTRLDYLGARDSRSVIVRAQDGFQVTEQPVALQTRLVMKSGVIRSSLFAATDASAIPDAVAIQLAELFAGDIDFHRGLRKGDRFSVVYELQTLDGRPVRTGRVLAAEFRNQGKAHRAVWFTGTDGKGGYYGATARPCASPSCVRRSNTRASARASASGIIRSCRPGGRTTAWITRHRPERACAPWATEWWISWAGKGGYGNVIIVRHAGNITTLYAHLLGYPRGLRKGLNVAQGEIIGAVGQSGWATGPHLHYEFRIAGQARDPLAVVLPAALPIAPNEMGAFRGQAEPLVTRLDLIGQGDLASLE